MGAIDEQAAMNVDRWFSRPRIGWSAYHRGKWDDGIRTREEFIELERQRLQENADSRRRSLMGHAESARVAYESGGWLAVAELLEELEDRER